MEFETNSHIGFECSFMRRVWSKIESKLRLINFWHGISVLNCVKNWCLHAEDRYRYLPVIVSWFIWKARNQCCFEDIQPKSYLITSLCLGLLSAYPLDNRVMNLRMVVKEQIEKSSPWGYFDGSIAGVPHICGAGGVLYLSDEHYFTFSIGLGLGTNNYAKLLALKLLFTLALKQGVQTLQIFGDSQLVINWVSGKFRINNILLTQVLQEVIRISNFLVKVDYKHIYRESNSKADSLANAGANVVEGHWKILEFGGSETYETFQIF